MTKYQKELEQIALRVSNMNVLHYNLLVNRRNGYYTVDKYGVDNGRFYGAAYVGNYKECREHLMGIMNAIYLMKAF